MPSQLGDQYRDEVLVDDFDIHVKSLSHRQFVLSDR